MKWELCVAVIMTICHTNEYEFFIGAWVILTTIIPTRMIASVFWRDELHDISILRKRPYHSQFELLGQLYNCKLLLISSDCCTQLLVYCNHCHIMKLNVDLQSFTYARIRTYIYAQIRTHIHINLSILISWNAISPTIKILWVKHQLNTGT